MIPSHSPLRIAIASQLQAPFRHLHELISGAQEYAAEAGWKSEICYVPEVRIEEGVQFDGIVGRITSEALVAARAEEIPVVNVWLNSREVNRIDNVFADFEAAGRMAAEHLLARGFRRLIALGPQRWVSTKSFRKGVEATAAEHGVVSSHCLLPNAPEENGQKWRQIVARMKTLSADWDQPVGLAVHLDENARVLAMILEAMGWDIPGQVAIVSTGNELLTCTAADPSLSSIDMGMHRNGYEAAALLGRLMNGEEAPARTIFTPPKELVMRRTTDVYAVRDPEVQRALRFMAENCHRKINVNDITAATKISRQLLERRFRAQLDTSINNELVRLRIERLKRLLVETDMPVKQLQSQAGFGAIGNMYKAFKEHTGMPLQAYREKHADPRRW
jgi:LacI family transcriptional regulator